MSGKVLITGGAGFIGSHLAEAYLAAGWEVTCLDDCSRGKATNVPRGARFVQADVRSAEARALVAGGGFDVLNHHAAQIDVRVSVAQPVLDADINLLGLLNLLDGAAAGGVRRVLFASSGGTVYGDPDVIPTPEPTAKAPLAPYGVAKLSSEYYLHAFSRLHGFETVALRYANVFGPRQDPNSEAGVCSIFIGRLLAGQGLTVFGDGTQTRDFVFVKDVARANLAASTATLPEGEGIDARAFNIATGTERSVNALAEAAGQVILGRSPEVQHVAARKGELARSCLDVSKAHRVLGWSPSWPFEDALGELVRWFRAGCP
ncbi:MAG: NAD-dependent epimerase/dehydratase family protein [Gemmatimonadales bacterium]|nr:NAD-dependent epimerase/dehydratase family protein [Gemmatimonadales bacterium]